MSPTNIRRLFRSAWVRAKQAEAVKNDYPIVGRVRASVIRTIAEFVVSRSGTEKLASTGDLNSEPAADDPATMPSDLSARGALASLTECARGRKLKVVIANHEHIIADTLAMILRQSNVDARASYSGVSALELVLSTTPDLAILCIVPAHPGDLNGVYAAVVVRTLMPACRILLVPGGSGPWVDEPLALAKTRGYEFELQYEPIHPQALLGLVKEILGEDFEPIRSLSVSDDG